MADIDGADMVQHPSAFPFEQTLSRLLTAIGKAGMTVFAQIDHALGARELGMAMPPTLVVLYGHARGGTPIMQACPQAALDLPLRVLVRADADGLTVIAFHPIERLLQAAGVSAELARRLVPAQQLLLLAIA
jgi:uncharacterized protein (DUF302 family)